MSSRGLLAGYRVAGAGQAAIVDLSAKADEVAKYKLLSDQVTYQRQKAFDDERKKFKMDMADAYDATIYEDNFDDTGITDLDAAGTKLQGQLKQAYIENQYAYDQGLIDEAEYKSRSNKLKGEVNQVQNLIGDINKATSEYQALEESGKGNATNRAKIRMLEDLGNNIRFTRGPNGLAINTLRPDVDEDGNETGLPPSEVSLGVRNFKDLLNMENGFDSTTAVENIVKRGGFTEELVKIGSGRGFDTKIKSFVRDDENVKKVVKAEAQQMSKSQKLDFLLKNDAITEDEAEKLIFSKEPLSAELSGKVEEGLVEDLQQELIFKQEQTVYKDDFALASYKSHLKASQGKEAKYVLARVTDEIAGDGRGNRSQYLPKKEGGIPFGNLTSQDRLLRTIREQISGLPDTLRGGVQGSEIEEDILKNAKIQMINQFDDTGQYELTFSYDLPITGDSETILTGGETPGQLAFTPGSGSTKQQFEQKSAKVHIKDIELLNQLFVAMGVEPISATQEDYEASVRQARLNSNQTRMKKANAASK